VILSDFCNKAVRQIFSQNLQTLLKLGFVPLVFQVNVQELQLHEPLEDGAQTASFKGTVRSAL
jgi:hypothetical protein